MQVRYGCPNECFCQYLLFTSPPLLPKWVKMLNLLYYMDNICVYIIGFIIWSVKIHFALSRILKVQMINSRLPGAATETIKNKRWNTHTKKQIKYIEKSITIFPDFYNFFINLIPKKSEFNEKNIFWVYFWFLLTLVKIFRNFYFFRISKETSLKSANCKNIIFLFWQKSSIL